MWTSIRLSAADHWFRKNNIASVKRAVALDPSNARYRSWLAELLDHDGEDPTGELEAASRLNPLDSRVWIRRGLAAELAGDFPSAEQLLLHAATVDRLFEPRWALANYYFRRADAARFRQWAASAFTMSYGDRAALFELCWRMRADAAWIAAMLPPGGHSRRQFAVFLADKARLADAVDTAIETLPEAVTADNPIYLELVDRMLAAGAIADAVRLWNALCRVRLLSYRKLDPANGASLTNGDFAGTLLGAGFDWKPGDAITAVRMTAPPALRLSLSGRQPEDCELLRQSMPVVSGRRYRLRFLFRTSGLEPPGGVRVRVGDNAAADLVSAGWSEMTLEFTGGAGGIATLRLEYRRPPGSMRAEGWIELRDLKLSFAG